MRHSVFGKKLSRDINTRKALLNSLANLLIVHGELTTTLAKAKFARSYIEKLVSTAKKDKLYKNRILASKLSGSAFTKLFNEIGPGFKERKGGYTKITRLAPRKGDAVLMAKLEFVEWDKGQAKAPKVAKGSKVSKVPKLRKVREVPVSQVAVGEPRFQQAKRGERKV